MDDRQVMADQMMHQKGIALETIASRITDQIDPVTVVLMGKHRSGLDAHVIYAPDTSLSLKDGSPFYPQLALDNSGKSIEVVVSSASQEGLDMVAGALKGDGKLYSMIMNYQEGLKYVLGFEARTVHIKELTEILGLSEDQIKDAADRINQDSPRGSPAIRMIDGYYSLRDAPRESQPPLLYRAAKYVAAAAAVLLVAAVGAFHSPPAHAGGLPVTPTPITTKGPTATPAPKATPGASATPVDEASRKLQEFYNQFKELRITGMTPEFYNASGYDSVQHKADYKAGVAAYGQIAVSFQGIKADGTTLEFIAGFPRPEDANVKDRMPLAPGWQLYFTGIFSGSPGGDFWTNGGQGGSGYAQLTGPNGEVKTLPLSVNYQGNGSSGGSGGGKGGPPPHPEPHPGN